MRGTTLERLVNSLRIEARLSLNPAHNANDRQQQVEHLQRVQEWLWEDFTWPHLRVERQIVLQAGQRYYALPAELSIERIEALEAFVDGRWAPLTAGIGGAQYSVVNSDIDEREGPPRRWRLTEDEMVELWPVPNRGFDATAIDGILKIRGIRNLKPLVDDGDTADLDDRLLVLFCAAERLAATGAKDAKLKQDQALKRYAKLRGDLSPIRSFSLGGSGSRVRTRNGHLTCGLGNSGSGSGGGTGPNNTVFAVTVDGGRRGEGAPADYAVNVTVDGGRRG